ncbi:alkaline phosphatase PhoX [Bythopirellula polymerisocia]|uniref:Phosphatase n=1 Tax=Bythopirellula polymerisocia TaxID=2528003 RepID=A0A5C6CDH6_9BACT|nr:alkaline phosphatase PhoX [Bythopirellula polymerisocia]TWU20859.1 hypothetical protein Pla144_47590 [Bythopirellula polymerisocia]
MGSSRRDFLVRSSAFAAGFCALRHTIQEPVWALEANRFAPYGPLVEDPIGVLDLPSGFHYQVISTSGQPMSDGFITPGKPDGMATFAGPDGLTILVRNHELMPYEGPGAFGKFNELFDKVDREKLYDRGGDKLPHRGGTTTIVYDTREQKVVREFLSLAGTDRNCAGGPTPWNSWITCEETVIRPGEKTDGESLIEQDHGYCFEVPATAEASLATAVPLVGMGRFNHEAVAVDPETGIVYLTEDREDGLFYRFIPNEPGKLVAGGKLQALRFRDVSSMDTRNWELPSVEVGKQHPVEWMDIADVTAPEDDLRLRGFSEGAARFARGEGIWFSEGQFFIACTSGGKKRTGQIWRLIPGAEEDSLELFIEPNDSALLESADNLTVAPWGDLMVCEDHPGMEIRIIGVTPKGKLYTFASNHLQTEFAGITFSPDGSTLFVNLQHSGMTVAITGPWNEKTLAG